MMNNYDIFTDSGSNLKDETFILRNIYSVPLAYYVNGKEYRNGVNASDEELKEFYDALRAHGKISTASANPDEFTNAFEPALKEGKDVLYIAFSSALSSTCAAGFQAVKNLKEKYPERKIIALDSLSGCLGQGLLVLTAADNRDAGMSIEDNYEFCKKMIPDILHCFTVDDLYFLYRGGRLTKTAFLAGTIAQIKPVMHVDDEGKLTLVSKVMGRRHSLKAVCEMVAKKIVNPEQQTIYIAHGDCAADVEYVKNILTEKLKPKAFYEAYLDPAIGAHGGPGALSIYALGKER